MSRGHARRLQLPTCGCEECCSFQIDAVRLLVRQQTLGEGHSNALGLLGVEAI